MELDITFNAIGLSFDATVEYDPGDPGQTSGPPERCYPPEADSVEIMILTVPSSENSEPIDMTILLESTVAQQIEDAALEEARTAYRDELEDRQAEAMADRYYEDRGE